MTDFPQFRRGSRDPKKPMDRASILAFSVLGLIILYAVYDSRGKGQASLVTKDHAYFWLSLVIALIFGEWAKGVIATHFRDSAPRRSGRLGGGIRQYIDLVGTLLVPALCVFVGFFPLGWARQMPLTQRPIRPRNAKATLLRLCGVVSNIALAVVVVAVGNRLSSVLSGEIILIASYLAAANIGLAALYLLPFYPLPGAAWLEAALPDRWVPRYERIRPYSLVIFIALIFFLPSVPGEMYGRLFNVFARLVNLT